MHLPLIEIPKPKRSARPRCASASLLFGACLAVVSLLLLSQYVALQQYVSLYDATVSHDPEASPVKYVTVAVRTPEKSSGTDSQWAYVAVTEYQKPLLELYDELSKMAERALNTARRSEIDGSSMPLKEQKNILLHFQKEFAAKYGLTLKDVTRIREEGCRQKHGTDWCMLSFITDFLEIEGKAFTQKYSIVLMENGDFLKVRRIK